MKRKPVTYDHPLEKRSLERTLGIILFQDQVNQLAIDVAGFAPSEADRLRRAFGRRHNEELLAKYHEKFMAGALERHPDAEAAEKVFNKFNGQYMFPESHAFAFGVTAYQASWLKYYYPLEFFVAIFNQQPMGFYNLETLKEDALRHGITVLNPDINKSSDKCLIEPYSDCHPEHSEGSVTTSPHSPVAPTSLPGRAVPSISGMSAPSSSPLSKGRVREGIIHPLSKQTIIEGNNAPFGEGQGEVVSYSSQKSYYAAERSGEKGQGNPNYQLPTTHPSSPYALRLGFLNVTGLGKASADAIMEGRNKHGPFKSIGEFLEYTGVLEEVAGNLAGSGAFDSLEPNRRKVKWEIGLRYRPINTQLPLQLPVSQDIVELIPQTDWEKMKEEYNLLSLYPGGHVMAKLRPRFGKGFRTSRDIEALRSGALVTAAGLVIRRQRPRGKVVFITLEDEFGHIPCMVFGQVYEKYEHTFRSAFLVIKGKLIRREGTINVVVDNVESFTALDKPFKSHDFR
jgi:DNA polymerase III alpha subunit